MAFKEFEDLPGVAANSPGGATFLESKPLDRDLNLVVGQSAPSGWMSAGRDYQLEQSIVGQLNYLLAGSKPARAASTHQRRCSLAIELHRPKSKLVPRAGNRGENRERLIPDGVLNDEPGRMQSDGAFPLDRTIGSGKIDGRTVLVIPDNGPAAAAKLDANLVHPTGAQIDLDESPTFGRLSTL